MADIKQAIIRIIHQNECNTLAPSSSSKLTYQVGVDDQTSQLYIRISENSGGGFFSNEWVSLEKIQSIIAKQPAKQSFRSLVFKESFVSRGANNSGFLGAALRGLGIVDAVPKSPFSHTAGDMSKFTKSMQALIKDGTSLPDLIAQRAEALEKKRKEQMETLRKVREAKAKETSKSNISAKQTK